MKTKIAILGSTGSIGKTLLSIIKKDKNNFEVVLLSANKNEKKLLKQAKDFNVKNLIITNKKSYKKIKRNLENKINLYNSFDDIKKIFKNKKIDYIMCSITGIDGLYPTLKSIKYTKKIAIANKEAIICGWDLINNNLKKFKTEFIPIDSEHFSIWFGLNNISSINISKIYLTASGGPFLNISQRKLKTVKISSALNHPNWKMGKKISIDSATMMNKIFEIIEARNIFNINLNKLSILIHPNSYVHAVIELTNGLTKIIAHDTTMKIPIFNSIYSKKFKLLNSKPTNFKILNNLQFTQIDKKNFPVVEILDTLSKKNSMFEIVIVSANDTLVDLFLKNKIKFTDISKVLIKFIKLKEFKRFKKIKPKKVDDIMKLNKYVHLKLLSNVYKYL